ncbi:RNA-binding protein [Angomonas deanei]|uniref:RNA recognition motif. (A.k.a. RRM, RBD, or RNP domain), putative n=1 Tax=Angomonas deanei TaxID=59799 RepID=A0A7G2CE75_9TRYP|nr:RNA-binding protein [Angomonas deanei]CAD2217685.1 RNA recognition motif. (a.k.a. RRM, RBD, or RNP domain), putative [Angomonas deanei]|eukprot:EPY42017.1 RNA-binding protein [Angomonas deanei]
MAQLFIGQLPFNKFYPEDLLALFSPYGTVIAHELYIKNGNGFVTYATTAEADLAIYNLHEKVIIEGRQQPLQVMYSKGSKLISNYGVHQRTFCSERRQQKRGEDGEGNRGTPPPRVFTPMTHLYKSEQNKMNKAQQPWRKVPAAGRGGNTDTGSDVNSDSLEGAVIRNNNNNNNEKMLNVNSQAFIPAAQAALWNNNNNNFMQNNNNNNNNVCYIVIPVLNQNNNNNNNNANFPIILPNNLSNHNNNNNSNPVLFYNNNNNNNNNFNFNNNNGSGSDNNFTHLFGNASPLFC